MNDKIKVLHVVGKIGKGGDTTAIYNVHKYILDNSFNYHFDYITHDGCSLSFINKLKKHGSKVFILPGDVRKIGVIRYYREIKKILTNYYYDAVHFHTSFQSAIGLIAAKRAGIKIRICHSHTSSIQRKINPFLKILCVPICKFVINIFATKKVACSMEAKNNLFYKKSKCKIVYNGLDIKYLKNIERKKSELISKRYNLDGKIIVGQVGRLTDMKNPLFTLEIAEKLKNSNYVFIFLGDGVQRKIMEKKIVDNQIDNVILTGIVSNVKDYMSIFDFLLLPSKYGEGLPVVLIEQQIINDKCLCVASDIVTKEANIGNVLYENIQYVDKWIEILKSVKKTSSVDFSKFNIELTTKQWINLYN